MPNVRRPEDERCLLQRRPCFQETTLRVHLMVMVHRQNLAGLHILTDVRLMSVRDVGRRGRSSTPATHRRTIMTLESIEEHLCFTQVRARLDDSLTGLLGSLAGLCFSVHHAASPPTTSAPTAGWTQMCMRVRTMRATPI